MKKLFATLIIFLFIQNQSYADVPHFLDFKFILNQSAAGKKAQDFLKDKLDKGIKFKRKRKQIQEEKSYSTKIISAKNIKKYQIKKKVSSYKERNKLLETVAIKEMMRKAFKKFKSYS